MKQLMAVFLCALLLFPSLPSEAADDNGLQISAPSVCLMEASTGKIVYEKNADEKRPPASVTKIMTLLLIFDALSDGKIALSDQVTVSEYAASMGGSQVFLEAGEVQTVDTMIKCIAVASANDACVAMAEYIGGTEEEFVNQMNERASDLGMDQTSFVNCNGLDTPGHMTTAKDIARMSRELLTVYPQIKDYAGIWMEDITHETSRGSSTFTLANTNKLIRQYAYATGLKTGSTDDAGFCVSATAEKNQMEMIAVVLGAESSRARFQDAAALLDYGFATCVRYIDDGLDVQKPVKVTGGVERKAAVRQKEAFRYVDTEGRDLRSIQKEFRPAAALKAPVREGDPAGSVVYSLDGTEIGRVDLVAAESVEAATYISTLEEVMRQYFPA